MPGDCTAPLERITAETVVTYGVVEPQEFPLPELPAPAAELLPLLGLRLLQLPQTSAPFVW